MQLTDAPKLVVKHESLTINGVPYEYVPIKVLEDTLNEIFGLYRTEIKSFQVANNHVTVVKRLIVDFEEMANVSHDGIASVPITPEVPQPVAISIANSIALKNAAENFGAVFGRDLNRVDVDLIHDGTKRNGKTAIKLKPDMEVIKMYEKALVMGDDGAVKQLQNTYAL